MKRSICFISCILLVMTIFMTAPYALDGSGKVHVISPYAAGVADGSAYFPMQNAFDAQPVLDEVSKELVDVGDGQDAPYYADRYGYIDFGPEWEKIRITSTWTKYRTWSGGDHTEYIEVWWDDDKDSVNDNGFIEPNINFNSAKGLNSLNEEQWAEDGNFVSDPITPKARFLILHSPLNMTNRAKEYAIIGYLEQGTNTNVVVGDLNIDGDINSSDYTLIKRYVLKIISEFPAPNSLQSADLNGDGKIDSTDCTLMKRYILKIIDKFPVEDPTTTPVPTSTDTATATPVITPTVAPIPTPTITPIYVTASPASTEPAWPEAKNTFILPVEGQNFIHYADLQRDLPQVDWNTLDRLYIPAGDYRFMKLGNLPKRSPDRPLIITNYAGRVRIGSDHHYATSIGGGSNWIMTGRYSEKHKTGHPDYIGHADGNYANSTGKYGIEVSHTVSSGVAVGGGATNFELEFIEVGYVGFAGLLIKTDNVPDAHMDGVKIHDMYIHDSESEGVYMGNTSGKPNEQHKFTNLEFYNNRIIRSGTEGLQLTNMGDGVHVHHNVVVLNALDWKNPFQIYQEGCFQYTARDGKASIHDNIFIGGAGNLFHIQFLAADGEILTTGEDEVHVYNNYFSHGRNYFSYILRHDSNKISSLKFENNWIRQINFHHNEINAQSTDYNVLFRAFNNKYNPLYFNNNYWEGDQVFLDVINGGEGAKDNVIASGNKNTAIEPIIFMDKTFPADFDYNRTETWDDYSDLYKVDIYFEKGDLVIDEGIMYECIKEGKHTGMKPSLYPDVWKVRTPMTDDFRLDPRSPYQGLGLIDVVQ